MTNSISIRKRTFASLVFGGAAAMALVATATPAHAAPIPLPNSVSLNIERKAQTAVPINASETDPAASGDLIIANLVDNKGRQRSFETQGIFVFVEPGLPVHTVDECTGSWPLSTTFGTWNTACSDIICMVNNPSTGQGEFWVWSDSPPNEWLDQTNPLPAFCRDPLNVVGSIIENPDPPGDLAGGRRLFSARAPALVAPASPAVDFQAVFKSDNTLSISDQLTVNVPALPPYGVVALCAVLAGLGVVFVRRRVAPRTTA